jgi:hypothetical protein
MNKEQRKQQTIYILSELLPDDEIKLFAPKPYFSVYLPKSPMANKNGEVPAHRLICWLSHGAPYYSECTYCDYPILWKMRVNVNHAQQKVVNVDHLNSDKLDNRPTNLVPACCWCNANREWASEIDYGYHGTFFDYMIDRYRTMPPWERPNMIDCAQLLGMSP